jgi:hypothetical protein
MLKSIIESKLGVLVITTILVVIFTNPLISQPLAQESNSPDVFRVEISNCTHPPEKRFQTGFKVTDLLGIVTALHGVADCNTFHAVSTASADNAYNLTLSKVNKSKDLALLEPLSGNIDINKGFNASDCIFPTASEKVDVIGHPLGIYGQLPRSLEIGIKATQTLQSLVPPASLVALEDRGSPSLAESVLQVEGSLLPGDSGAPVLYKNCVIGVVNGGLLSGTSGISWVMPWIGISWDNAATVDSEDWKDQPVNEIFTFAGDERIDVVDLKISINNGDYFPIQIPIDKKEPKSYDLRLFGITPVTDTNESIFVSITDINNSNVIADGTINFINRNLQVRDGKYQSIEVDISRRFILLEVAFADDSPLSPTPQDTFTFKILVKNKCTDEIISTARVIGFIGWTINEKTEPFDQPTGTKGEIYIERLSGKPEDRKIVITSIKTENFRDLLTHELIPNLNQLDLEWTIKLLPLEEGDCTNLGEPSRTINEVGNTSLATPSPIFIAPIVCLAPNRIAKEHLAIYCKTTLTELDRLNPSLPNLVEIDTIIVIPTSTPIKMPQ